MGNPYTAHLAYLEAGSPVQRGLLGDYQTEFRMFSSEEGVKQLRHLQALWEQHADAVRACEDRADADGLLCRHGEPLREHEAGLNTYLMDPDTYEWEYGEPMVMWAAWHGDNFCLPATWRPSTGLEWDET